LRARILEETAVMLKHQKASECFLLGLFSLLDAFLDQPMDVSLEQVCLPQEVHDGLTDPSSYFGSLLHMVKSIESGNWEEVDSVCREKGLQREDLASIQVSAIKWVDEYSESLN